MSRPDRLNPLDVWFLHLEDGAGLLHIGSLLVLEGPAPPFAEIREAYASRTEPLARYRQVVRRDPLGLRRPEWVADPHFHLDYHLRHTALPAPGGDEQLRALVGRVMGQRLDRHRPLWEAWVVEGLSGGRWAVIAKVHHCMVDGIAGTDLTTAILDPPGGSGRPPPTVRTDDAPGRLPQAVRAALAGTRGIGRVVRHPGPALRQGVAVAHGMLAIAGLGHLVPASSLTGPIGPHRRWDWARADLAAVKDVGHRLDATVNDVILAAVAQGFTDLLARRGEPHAVVRSLIPVSLRSPDGRGLLDNRVTALFITLPTQVLDPLERLRAVQSEIRSLRDSGEAMASAALVAGSGLVPPLLLGPAMRLTSEVVDRVGQRMVSTVVTNVPGPQVPLHLLGRRVLEWFPYVPIAEAVRIGVAILSHDGQIRFGITGEWDHAEDLAVLASGIEQGIDELIAAARPARPSAGP